MISRLPAVAHVVGKLIVNATSHVGVLEEGVGGEHGVVWPWIKNSVGPEKWATQRTRAWACCHSIPRSARG